MRKLLCLYLLFLVSFTCVFCSENNGNLTAGFVELSLSTGQQHTLTVPLSVRHEERRVTMVRADCACIQVRTPLPMTIPAGQSASVEILVRGGLPGSKRLQFQGSAEEPPFLVHVRDPNGRGSRGELEEILKKQRAGKVYVIVHDPRDLVPGACACSGGRLGGADRLVSVAKVVRSLRPSDAGPLSFVLTGVLSADPSLKPTIARLEGAGWQVGHSDVLVSNRPKVALVKFPSRFIIPRSQAVPTRVAERLPNHARLIRPVLPAGQTIEVLTVDQRTGRVQAFTLPVDDSFDP